MSDLFSLEEVTEDTLGVPSAELLASPGKGIFVLKSTITSKRIL